MLGKIVNAVCFWLLIGLAYVLFIVAVLRPPFLEYRKHLETEARMQAAVDELAKKVEANDAQIKLLDPNNPDPLMLAKLAREQLNYQLEGGQEVPVRLAEPEGGTAPALDDGPAAGQGGGLAGLGVEALVGPQTRLKLEDPRVQRLLLLMSAVAMCMAFVFFGTVTKNRASEQAQA